MKKNLTEIVFILDRRGSVASLEDDTMIAKQKGEPSEAACSGKRNPHPEQFLAFPNGYFMVQFTQLSENDEINLTDGGSGFIMETEYTLHLEQGD